MKDAKTPAERVAAYRLRLKHLQLETATVVVPLEDRQRIQQIARELRADRGRMLPEDQAPEAPPPDPEETP